VLTASLSQGRLECLALKHSRCCCCFYDEYECDNGNVDNGNVAVIVVMIKCSLAMSLQWSS
jgi:hypothetical protein